MKNIDINLIKKYVNGENIDDYTIEMLENDKEFMMYVICYTNDSNMYSLCSDNLKKDYDFVRFLIYKFKENPSFIIKVADYFLDNTDTDIERLELNIMLIKLLPKELSNKYVMFSEAAYHTKRVELEINKIEEPVLADTFGMGFFLMFDLYNSNDTIIKYYAKSMINEILKDNNINFEVMLHDRFKSADEITNFGIINYIISFLSSYDSTLSLYIKANLELIDDIVNEIKLIIKNWESYILKNERKRYMKMFDMVHEYFIDSGSTLYETDILYFVAQELGIGEKVAYYDGYSSLEKIEIDFEFIKEEIESDSNDQLVYSNIKKIMLNQIFSDTPGDLDSIIGEGRKKEKNNSAKKKHINLKPKDKKE